MFLAVFVLMFSSVFVFHSFSFFFMSALSFPLPTSACLYPYLPSSVFLCISVSLAQVIPLLVLPSFLIFSLSSLFPESVPVLCTSSDRIID